MDFNLTARQKRFDMNLLVETLASLVFCLTCCLPAQEGTPSIQKRLFIVYGDYQSPPGGLVQAFIRTGEPRRPELEQLHLGIGAHGDTEAIWRARVVGWITGNGKVADAKAPLAPGQRWAAQIPSKASAFEGRKADLVQVQLNLGYTLSNRSEQRAITEEAVAGYVAAARAAGANLVFYVVPGNQHTTHKIVKRGEEPVKKTGADFQPELQAMEAECQRLTKTYGAVMAPTHRAFAALRTAHSEIERPMHCGPDGHLHPEEAVLVSLVISRAFLGEGEHPLPTPEVLLAPFNQDIAKENLKRKAKGEAEKPLITIDAGTWKAMLEATTAAFATPPNLRGKP
jgi:hypothetical protein